MGRRRQQTRRLGEANHMITKQMILDRAGHRNLVRGVRQHERGDIPFVWQEVLPVLLLLTIIAVFYGFTMRAGMLGNDDTAQYIQHAKNISEAAPYGRIPWVYHADGWNPGPRVYPPIFPLFLAPLYHVFGANLKPMHLLVLAFFIGSLAVVYLTFRNELGSFGALSAVAIIGFNPYFWELRDAILSDIPFLCLCYLALLMARKVISREESGEPFLLYSILTGVAMYAACGTRSVGLVMIPAVLVWSLVRRVKIMKSVAIMTAVCAVLELVESATLHTLQAYASQYAFERHPPATASGITRYVATSAHYWMGALATLWANSYSHRLALAFSALTLLLALLGLAVHLSWTIEVYDVFALFYIPALLSWTQMRYLIPLVPFYLFYSIRGVLWLMGRTPRWCAVALPSALLAVVTITYGSDYCRQEPQEPLLSTASPQAEQMFNFIRTQTTAGDVIGCMAPRTLSLYTGRKSSMYDYTTGSTTAELTTYFCRTGITYIVVTADAKSAPGFYDFVQSNRDSWSRVFENSMFQLYRVPQTCAAAVRAEQRRWRNWSTGDEILRRHLAAKYGIGPGE